MNIGLVYKFYEYEKSSTYIIFNLNTPFRLPTLCSHSIIFSNEFTSFALLRYPKRERL